MKSHSFINDQIYATFDRHLELPNWQLLDAVCATYLGNYIGRPRLWLVIVGPAGSAKTVIVESLRGLPNVHPVGGFTPNSFVSGSINKKAKVGLLEQLTDEVQDGTHHSVGMKFLTMNDVGQLFGLPSAVKGELLSQLRDIYDGHINKRWGTGKVFDWRGDIGLIAASTYFWDQEVETFSAMGERFLVWREQLPTEEGADKALRKAAGQNPAEMAVELREIMKLLAEIAGLAKVPKVSWRVEEWLIDLTKAISVLRTPILRDRWSKEQLEPPRPEFGGRLIQQLKRFMQGMMVWRGIPEGDEEAFETQVKAPTLRLALGCVPQTRVDILRTLGPTTKGQTTEEIGDAIGLSRTTTYRKLDDLRILGVVTTTVAQQKVVAAEWREFVRCLL